MIKGIQTIKKKVKPRTLCKILGIKYKWYESPDVFYSNEYNIIWVTIRNKEYEIGGDKDIKKVLDYYDSDYLKYDYVKGLCAIKKILITR